MFSFNNFTKKSIPGDVQAQVLQEPAGTSHPDQGWKSEMPYPFSDPGGQEESTGTPNLALASKGRIPQGGSCSNTYKDSLIYPTEGIGHLHLHVQWFLALYAAVLGFFSHRLF